MDFQNWTFLLGHPLQGSAGFLTAKTPPRQL